jgi:hypothetical protein
MTRCVLFLAVAGLLLACGRATVATTPSVTAPTSVETWHRVEFQIAGVPSVANPFDPEQIRLDATLVAPSGRTLTIPAFWTEDYRYNLIAGEEYHEKLGTQGWRLRFTPEEVGEYRLSVSLALGTNSPQPFVQSRFSVTASGSSPSPRGWVRVAPDQRSLQLSDGRPLRLIGENVCWPVRQGTYDYEMWFDAMRASGQNFARLWMCPWWAALEQTPGTLNRYNLDAAGRMDRIFELARERGIFLLLAIDFHGMFQVNNPNWGGGGNIWPRNPYHRNHGGPCVDPNDFFTNPEARKIYQKRLRYLVARYGAENHLVAWQFFNEIDNVYGPGLLQAADVADWHGEMGRWLKQHDPFGHLVTTSLTGGSDRPEIWTLPEMDFTVYHSYGDTAPGRFLAEMARSQMDRYRKPFLVGEFGAEVFSWSRASDAHMRGFRQALWGTALSGSLGTMASWWWEDIHTDNLYPLYSTFTRLMQRAGWHEGEWRPATLSPAWTPPPTTVGEKSAEQHIYSGRVFLRVEPWFSDVKPVALTGQLAAERAAESLSGYVGPANPQYDRRSIVLDGWWAGDARLFFRVGRALGDVEPVVLIDGKEVWREALKAPASEADRPRKLDTEFQVMIPAGRHRIELANEHAVWLYIDSLRVQGLRPSEFAGGWRFHPESIALRRGNSAVLYTVSPHIVFPAGAQRYRPPAQRGERVTLHDWTDGHYEIEWHSPETGARGETTRAVARNSQLELTLPDFEEDLVALIRPQP